MSSLTSHITDQLMEKKKRGSLLLLSNQEHSFFHSGYRQILLKSPVQFLDASHHMNQTV